MVRPQKPRRIRGGARVDYFKPQGVPLSEIEELGLTLDGLEALRLADVEGLYQEEAAERMEVSRATFGRILAEARRLVATALVKGAALRIEGGVVVEAGPGRGHKHGRGPGRGCGPSHGRRGHGHRGRGRRHDNKPQEEA